MHGKVGLEKTANIIIQLHRDFWGHLKYSNFKFNIIILLILSD